MATTWTTMDVESTRRHLRFRSPNQTLSCRHLRETLANRAADVDDGHDRFARSDRHRPICVGGCSSCTITCACGVEGPSIYGWGLTRLRTRVHLRHYDGDHR